MMRMIFGLLLVAIIVVLVAAGRRWFDDPRQPDAAFTFDLSAATKRYRQSSGLDEATARRHETEFRRFFSLIARNPNRSYGLNSAPIDAFWHELICCTALYRDYCRATAGRFIDHDPQGGNRDANLRTWLAYCRQFGEPDPAVWPSMAVEAEQRRSLSGDDGGGLLITTSDNSSCHDGGGHSSCAGHGCGSSCGGGGD